MKNNDKNWRLEYFESLLSEPNEQNETDEEDA